MISPATEGLLDALQARRGAIAASRASLASRADLAQAMSAALRSESARERAEAARLTSECRRLLAEAARRRVRLSPMSPWRAAAGDARPAARPHGERPPAARGAPR